MGHEFLRRNFTVGHQEVGFAHAAPGELVREGPVGQRRFTEHQHAAGLLIQPVDNGQGGPARLAVFQPIVNALARVRRGRVRVPAGRFVNRQQVVIFKNHTRNHAA